MVDSASPVRKFSHHVIVASPRLMDMWYTPVELAEELQIPPRTVREWTHYDLPHQKDAMGRLWINGIQFAAWVDQVRAARPKINLREGEGYCLKCKCAVEIQEAQKTLRDKMNVLTGQCPRCGSVVNRVVARDQSE